MKKENLFIIFKCIIFIGIFAYLFIHISYAMRPALAHTHKNISGYYAEPKNSLDVVLIGSSGLFSAFAPLEAWNKYGFTSYNFCTNAQGVDSVPFVIKESLKTQKPKVLVVDCFNFIHRQVAREFDDFTIRYNTDGFKYSLDRINLINKVIPESRNKLSFYFDIIKYHSEPMGNDFFYSKHNPEKGFQFLPWGISKKAPLTTKVSPLSPDMDKYLDDILKESKKQNTKIIFTYMPYGYISDEASEQVNYIAKKVKNNGFEFLNLEQYQNEINLDMKKDCWDVRHFNIYGAEKITAFLAKYLAKNYNLPDNRNNKKFSKWNDDYKIWLEEVPSEKKIIDDLIKKSEKQ